MLFMACLLSAPVFAEVSESVAEEHAEVFKFNTVRSVYKYLEEGTYVGNGLVVNIKHDGVYANGRCLTGAVFVERYTDDVVLISMTPPGYDRVYFRIEVNNNCLIDNQGYLYIREK